MEFPARWRVLSRRRKGWSVGVRCLIRRRLCGTVKRILTGFGLGIILYGASPSGQWRDIANTGLRPVMTLSSEIIGVQTLKAGERVGYGGRYTARDEQRIGIVAAGYADGYPRHAPIGTPVLVDGVRTMTVGTVSMDMLAVDLTPCPQAGIGTPVELWGKEIKIDDVAAAAGTVGYELMCALALRVPVVTV